TNDQVDVNYDISERPAGQINIGVGYSDAEGFLVSGGVKTSNFRGTGNTARLSGQINDFTKVVTASYTNPYYTPEGVSRTFSAFYRKTDQLIRSSSSFNLNSYGGAMTFNFPITEYMTFRAGLGVERDEITSLYNISGKQESSDEVANFVKENGSTATTYALQTGIERDTRNRTVFATRGSDTRLRFDIKGPGSDLEYYKVSLKHER